MDYHVDQKAVRACLKQLSGCRVIQGNCWGGCFGISMSARKFSVDGVRDEVLRRTVQTPTTAATKYSFDISNVKQNRNWVSGRQSTMTTTEEGRHLTPKSARTNRENFKPTVGTARKKQRLRDPQTLYFLTSSHTGNNHQNDIAHSSIASVSVTAAGGRTMKQCRRPLTS